MRAKRGRNTNIKILQSQIQNIALETDNKPIQNDTPKVEKTGSGIPPKAIIEVNLIDKLPKKRGIPKDELINTKRLLTM